MTKTTISFVQSRFGNLFFLPKSCIPGYHEYIISIEKVPKEKAEEECIMCYNPLKYILDDTSSRETPDGALNPGRDRGGVGEDAGLVGSDSNPVVDPLMKKAKTCVITPCKHYFHVTCFNQWVEVKHECPICRTHLKFYAE